MTNEMNENHGKSFVSCQSNADKIDLQGKDTLQSSRLMHLIEESENLGKMWSVKKYQL